MAFPSKCILLVDTYDTLESGVPNAITVGREMAERGEHLDGIRLDSGDLAWLAKRARVMLDDAGLEHVKISASNQLDEYVIKSLLEQEAPIDAFGVGTRLVTSYDCPALDGVYKLSQVDQTPRLKISENRVKVNFPGLKQVLRLIDSDGMLCGDCIVVDGQHEPTGMVHPFDATKQMGIADLEKVSILRPVMEGGAVLVDRPSPQQSAEYARSRLACLPEEHKRFRNPHVYKVGLSEEMRRLRDETYLRLRDVYL